MISTAGVQCQTGERISVHWKIIETVEVQYDSPQRTENNLQSTDHPAFADARILCTLLDIVGELSNKRDDHFAFQNSK